MIFVPTANAQGVDTRIQLDSGQSGFETGYDRIVYIGKHFPSTLVAFVRRRADGTEDVLASPAVKLACAMKAGKNLRRGLSIVDVEAGRTVEAYVPSNQGFGRDLSSLDFDRLLLYAGAGAPWLASYSGDVAGAKTFILAQARALDSTTRTREKLIKWKTAEHDVEQSRSSRSGRAQPGRWADAGCSDEDHDHHEEFEDDDEDDEEFEDDEDNEDEDERTGTLRTLAETPFLVTETDLPPTTLKALHYAEFPSGDPKRRNHNIGACVLAEELGDVFAKLGPGEAKKPLLCWFPGVDRPTPLSVAVCMGKRAEFRFDIQGEGGGRVRRSVIDFVTLRFARRAPTVALHAGRGPARDRRRRGRRDRRACLGGHDPYR